MEALLDRDAELGELGRLLAAARAGSGRVIVVAGPAGIGKSTLLAAAGATARTDGAVVLRARCSPLEQHAAWGMARQLFDPLRARPDWDGLTAGAAGLAGRVLAPEAGEPANAGDAMHAAVRGLVWLARRVRRRRRPLGRRSVPALAGAAGAVPGRTADRGALRGALG
jgi:energy-coupling factor transporter ATP-binding protein EcfA2